MRKIIQIPVVLSLLFATTLVSCNNFGKKIKIDGTKGEVYYKDGATESEAKKVGDFLKEAGFLGNEKGASVQVSKENEGYTIRFVYDKEYYDKTEGLESIFKLYGAKLSKEIFDGNKVNIALADKQFKDFKKIPYDEATAKSINQEAPPAESLNKGDFDHDTQGGVTFYWKGISDKESKTIADYIVETGAFTGGPSEIYMIKENDHYTLKFPVKEDYRNDPATIAEIEKVAKQIKENVFANSSYSFQMTDEKLNPIKSFDY
jgi:hypothetical protein